MALACVTEPSQPKVHLAVSVSATDMPVGRIDTIVATATNITDRSFTLHFPSTCQVLLFIRRAGGEVVVPSGGAYFCGQETTTLRFAAGESKRIEAFWAGGTSWVGHVGQSPLPPGAYEAYAGLTSLETAVVSLPVAIQLRAGP